METRETEDPAESQQEPGLLRTRGPKTGEETNKEDNLQKQTQTILPIREKTKCSRSAILRERDDFINPEQVIKKSFHAVM